MERGKQVCKILKDIRKQIAEENDIEFITSECQHKGDCAGTCPKCEAELRYLESQLARRSAAGFPARLAGIALGLAAVAPTLTSCDWRTTGDMRPPELEGDIEELPLGGDPAEAMNLRFSMVLILSTPVYALYICGFISLMSMTYSSMTGARRSTCSCATFNDVSMLILHGLGQTLRNSLMNALLRAGSPPPNVTPPPVA